MQVQTLRKTASSRKGISSLSMQLKALADPTRLAILELLMNGLQCNCNLGNRLGLPINLISHHLKVLRGAGLVTFSRDEQDGRWIYYAIDAGGIASLKESLAAFLNPERIMNRPPVCGPQMAGPGGKTTTHHLQGV